MAKTLTPRQRRARARRRERLKADLRDGVFRLCTLAGLLIAAPWALSHVGEPRCAEATTCLADQLDEMLMPVMARLGAGLFAGMLVAVLLCTTVPGLKRRDV